MAFDPFKVLKAESLDVVGQSRIDTILLSRILIKRLDPRFDELVAAVVRVTLVDPHEISLDGRAFALLKDHNSAMLLPLAPRRATDHLAGLRHPKSLTKVEDDDKGVCGELQVEAPAHIVIEQNDALVHRDGLFLNLGRVPCVVDGH